MRRSRALVAGVFVVASCGAGDQVATRPWALTAVDGARLSLVVEMSGDTRCENFDHVDVDESADTVELTAFVRVREQDACDDIGKYFETVVVLDAPLGGRAVTGCRTEEAELLPASQCAELFDGGP